MMTAVDDHQTKKRVEARFKSDLDGMLEYFERNPSVRETITTELLQEHFDTTFDRTKSFTVSAAFAKVLLNALINRKGKSTTDIRARTIDQAYAEYQNDFSVPRFADGLRTNEFLKLMDIYDLYGAVIHHLYTLDTRSALFALQNIFKENASDVKSFKSNLYTTYIKLLFTLDVDDEDFYQQSEDAFIEEICQSSEDPIGLFVIANLLQQMLIQASLQNRNKTVESGMRGLPQAIIAAIPATFRSQLGTFLSESSPTSKKRKLSYTIYLQNRNCQNTRTYEPSLKEAWESVKHKETGLSKHETAFVLICSHLERKIIPTCNKSSSRSLQSKEKYLTAFEELQTTIRNNDTAKESLIRVKLWCIDVLINSDRFWISVLKIIIQFIDVWSRDIVKAGAETVIGSFIAKEKLLEPFSERLSELVKFYEQSGDKSSLYIIKDACLIYERSIDCIESPEYLNSIRQLLFNERLPCFGLAEIWNIRFNEELTLIINQITITEDDDECFTTQSTSKKLVLMSILWPYKVVYQLIKSSISNKNQYKAIIPLLKNLGNICTLTKSSDALPLIVFADITSLEALNDSMSKEICKVFKSLFVENDSHCPVILQDQAKGYMIGTFLSKYVFTDLVVMNTISDTDRSFKDQEAFRLALYILNAFCEFPPGKEQDWKTFISQLDYTPVMYSVSSQVGAYFIYLLGLYKQSDGSRPPPRVEIQDKELILKYLERLAIFMQHDNDRYGNQPSCSSYDLIQSLESAADNWGQLLWLDHFPAIAKSKTFRNISKDGQENGLKDKFSKEGWEYLFKMCLLSTRMTDNMFMVTSTWKENLECLWMHPYECKVIKEGFQHALHPQNGFSLCPLFPKLIVYFLGALFETLPSEDVIRRYDYASTGSKYLVHRLTRAGLKQYFSILYAVELIKDQLRKDYDVADEMDCYYISSLIKTIRELVDWSKLCHVQGTPGYQQLRKLLTQNTSDIECLNYASYTNDNDAQGNSIPIIKIYYPLLGEESISNRSLALLTITHLCTLSVEARRNELISALLSMLVMQITEGLIDARQQQHFNTMLSNQTKDRANRWRKLKRQKKVMIYRPILSNEEELAVIDFVRQLPNADQVLQALELNGPKPLDNTKQLYFL
ncbi:hypothetical protein G6F70_007817 [Rhizopus microsporus]|nr:hypothetical protein G6F71_007775 [Rhizopus microsporus]KAG1195973.1 hypothetical protein G6F70_007817 [Rhizopus microsporus]KAG1207856.1 hypothetical protein G6F69_007706 [Rhizopus microsporus]KAG1228763.1 hypothetical protein G6F67_007616 [Rhizopus microsporus]KAG1260783.1 hypothetical protein G6F68_007172 [Rhizopus microsporus]